MTQQGFLKSEESRETLLFFPPTRTVLRMSLEVKLHPRIAERVPITIELTLYYPCRHHYPTVNDIICKHNVWMEISSRRKRGFPADESVMCWEGSDVTQKVSLRGMEEWKFPHLYFPFSFAQLSSLAKDGNETGQLTNKYKNTFQTGFAEG